MKFLKNNKFELIILTLLPVVFLYKMIFFGEIVVTNDELERHPINEWSNNYFIENEELHEFFDRHEEVELLDIFDQIKAVEEVN